MAQDVADIINSKGVKSQRTWQQVKSKIERIEAQMKQAFEWCTCETGAGKKDGDKSFEDSVLKYCPFFNELVDKFQDRSAMVPKCNTDDVDFLHDDALDNNSDDSNDSKSTNSRTGKTKTSSKKLSNKTSSRSSRKGKLNYVQDAAARRDELMCQFLETTIAKKKRVHEDDGEHIERLAKQFENTVCSLSGNRIQAAFTCPKFKVFLIPEEWPLLKHYKKAMEQARLEMGSSSEESDSDNK